MRQSPIWSVTTIAIWTDGYNGFAEEFKMGKNMFAKSFEVDSNFVNTFSTFSEAQL